MLLNDILLINKIHVSAKYVFYNNIALELEKMGNYVETYGPFHKLDKGRDFQWFHKLTWLAKLRGKTPSKIFPQ